MGENKLAMIVLAGGASSRMGKEKSDLSAASKPVLIKQQRMERTGVLSLA